ncbi:MAG: M48 family metallopeptidase [Gammaproteobacteria bacterium]|nr:M48 family metallopeptidase [Gammaproteobacteria bacterium]
MDFFEHQDRARRKTGVLAIYFALAVLGIVLAVNAAVYGVLALSGAIPTDLKLWLGQPWWLAIAALTLLVIAGGSLVRSWQLKGGGVALNQMLGARPILATTTEPGERRLINVVEEMAIAAGMPVPILFILDEEESINAFVAGLTPGGATLTVTRGALDQLSRDELQGVVGHEFSHILNADMRINLRLIGLLAGILAIGQLGEFLLEMRGGGRLSSRKGNGGIAAILGLGLALTLIGWIGLFFGRLIKAAISRQREFLADASSVQFTRNPDGIAGALARIGAQAGAARMHNAHAEEMSHMCFGMSVPLAAWFATHPPIPERIKAIKGRHVDLPNTPGSAVPDGETLASGFAAPTAAQSLGSIGTGTPEAVQGAGRWLDSLSPELRQADRDPEQAQALVLALFLRECADREGGLGLLARQLDTSRLEAVRDLLAELEDADRRGALPLLELALPALRLLDRQAALALLLSLRTLARRDGRLSLFECAAELLVERSLSLAPVPSGHIRRFEPVLGDLAIVFSLLTEQACEQGEARQALYMRIMKGFGAQVPPRPSARSEAFVTALRRLADLSPLLKRSVIEACADCVLADRRLVLGEYEALHAVCAALDCPLPPLGLDAMGT